MADYNECSEVWNLLQRSALAGNEVSERWCRLLCEASDTDMDRIMLLGLLLREEPDFAWVTSEVLGERPRRSGHFHGPALESFMASSSAGEKRELPTDEAVRSAGPEEAVPGEVVSGDQGSLQAASETGVQRDARSRSVSPTLPFDPVEGKRQLEARLAAVARAAASAGTGVDEEGGEVGRGVDGDEQMPPQELELAVAVEGGEAGRDVDGDKQMPLQELGLVEEGGEAGGGVDDGEQMLSQELVRALAEELGIEIAAASGEAAASSSATAGSIAAAGSGATAAAVGAVSDMCEWVLTLETDLYGQI
jgi:hypothetical protein